MSNLNWVDVAILGVFVLSILIGIWRGFIKEFLSLLTWALAFIAGIILAEPLAAKFTSSSQVQSAISSSGNEQSASYLATSISFVCIFVGVLILGKILSYILSSAAETGGVGFGNRFLGAVFGLARGFLVVLIGMFLVEMSPITSQSEWKKSYFVEFFDPIVKWLDDTMQPQVKGIKSKATETWKNVSTQYLQGNVSGVPGRPASSEKSNPPSK